MQPRALWLPGRGGADLYGTSAVGAVLCCPHPLWGGWRRDARLLEVARCLVRRDRCALCLDYGVEDALERTLAALRLLEERAGRPVGLFGYSFGAAVAATAAEQHAVAALVLMALPPEVEGLRPRLRATCPKLFIQGSRDPLAPPAALEELFERAAPPKERLVLEADHLFLGREAEAAEAAAAFLDRYL